MISNEAIPVKEEKESIPVTTEQTKLQEIADEKPPLVLEHKKTVEITTSSSSSSDSDAVDSIDEKKTTDEEVAAAEKEEAEEEEVVARTARRKFNLQFQQRTNYLREMWSERKRVKVNNDFSQFWCLIVLCFIAIFASLVSISTSNWTCGWTTVTIQDDDIISNSNTSSSSSSTNNDDDEITKQEWQWSTFGVWNTCNRQQTKTQLLLIDTDNENENDDSNSNSTSEQTGGVSWAEPTWWCAKQDLGKIVMQLADQTRLDQVTAAQSLMSVGIAFYAFSLVCIVFGFRFLRSSSSSSSCSENTNNNNNNTNNNDNDNNSRRMNKLRNALITSLLVQVFAFLMMLIGFFLFVYTDRLSISVVLLFVYFVFAIFATNLINFITIEYKTYKTKKAACS